MYRITRGFRGFMGRSGVSVAGYTGSAGIGFQLKKSYESV
jgi:hypothetical protein